MQTSEIQNLARMLVSAEGDAATSEQGSRERELAEEIRRLTWQFEEARRAGTTQAEVLRDNTHALIENAAAKSANPVVAAAANAGKALLGTIAKGSGIVPLISGLTGLFRSKKEEPPALEKFLLPEAIRLEAGLSSDRRLTAIDYSHSGAPRAMNPVQTTPSITVNVQAMDSRSFLDHSGEIAQAVREAMLNSHSLNDVVAEL